MICYILDTGIAGLYIEKKRGVFERARKEVSKGNRIGIAGPVLAELVYRAEGSPLRDKNIRRLRDTLKSWKLWLPNEKALFEYGRIAFALRAAGRPIGQNDIMIAAIALTIGNSTVVTMDSDLSAVPGLMVENWAESP